MGSEIATTALQIAQNKIDQAQASGDKKALEEAVAEMSRVVRAIRESLPEVPPPAGYVQ